MKDSNLRHIICIIGALTLAITMLYGMHIPVSAGGASNVSGEVVTLKSATDAFDAPSEDANVVHSFAAGEVAFITGEESGFQTIFWKGETLYIKEGVTKNSGSADGNDYSEKAEEVPLDDGIMEGEVLKAALEKEFEQAAIEDVAVVESFVRQEEAKKRALIWKIIIGALVAGILIVSVIIGIKNSKVET